MDRSQEIAAAVALRELRLEVGSDPEGALVAAVAPDAPAEGKLEATDVIVEVDGKAVRRRTICDAWSAAASRATWSAWGSLRRRHADGGPRTVESPEQETGDHRRPGRAVRGDRPPLDVDIDLGGVGGPSAGLAFSLEVLEKLGRDVDRGNGVAATGEIELDGGVAPIGGIDQKTRGARDAGMDVFLVAWGKRRGGTAQRSWAADHRGGQFSTGVAKAGNPAGKSQLADIFRQPRKARKLRPFPRCRACRESRW